MARISEVLHRRSDLATFVVHFTRGSSVAPAEQNLVQIMVGGRIEARTPMGWAREVAESAGPEAADSQRAVCFSEAPLEHLYSLTGPIDGRRVSLEPYGVAFTKMVARRKGANPVWYVDMTPGHDWLIANALDRIREDAATFVKGGRPFEAHPGANVFPFFEGMGTWPSRQKEFWWEREWRKVGNFEFDLGEVAIIIAPEVAHPTLRRHFERPVIDVSWGMERVVASLANLPEADLTPF